MKSNNYSAQIKLYLKYIVYVDIQNMFSSLMS